MVLYSTIYTLIKGYIGYMVYDSHNYLIALMSRFNKEENRFTDDGMSLWT